MKDIKVEGYARTKIGEIYVVWGRYERGQFGEMCIQLADFKTKEPQYEEWERDLKISKKIIELIEPGDYVNGYRVYHVAGHYVSVESLEKYDLCFEEQDIKTIVTREQFKSMQYKLEAED